MRAVVLPTSSIVMDPATIDVFPDAWQAATASASPAPYHRWRVRQVTENHALLGGLPRTFRRNEYWGRPAYLVGAGPSASLARDLLPRRPGRRGIVCCLNSAAAWFPGDHDLWFSSCALWPGVLDDDEKRERAAAWERDLDAYWSTFDHAGARMLAHLFTSTASIRRFRDGGGGDVGFFCGANVNPYRLLCDEAPLAFVEGLQGAVSALHFLYWLGCGPIALFGLEHARPLEWSGTDRLHGHDGSPGWRPGGIREAHWYHHPGVGGRTVETTYPMAVAAMHISALAMWMADDGRSVVNCSQGLDYGFAPPVEPARILAATEGGGGGDAEKIA